MTIEQRKELVEKARNRMAFYHAHECFPNNWGGKSGQHKVHIENQTQSNLAGSAPWAAIALELAEVLDELNGLMEDVRNGEYKPDSFTCQPAQSALAKFDAFISEGK